MRISPVCAKTAAAEMARARAARAARAGRWRRCMGVSPVLNGTPDVRTGWMQGFSHPSRWVTPVAPDFQLLVPGCWHPAWAAMPAWPADVEVVRHGARPWRCIDAHQCALFISMMERSRLRPYDAFHPARQR